MALSYRAASRFGPQPRSAAAVDLPSRGVLDLTYVRDQGFEGSITLHGGHVNIAYVNGVGYVGVESYWFQLPPADGRTWNQEFGYASALNAFDEMGQDTYSLAGQQTVDGVVCMVFQDEETGETLYVAALGTHYLIRDSDGSGAQIDFSGWDKPVSINAPKVVRAGKHPSGVSI